MAKKEDGCEALNCKEAKRFRSRYCNHHSAWTTMSIARGTRERFDALARETRNGYSQTTDEVLSAIMESVDMDKLRKERRS